MMTETSMFDVVAGEFSEAFERRTRDNGESFYRLRDDAAEWLQGNAGSTVMHELHAALDDRLPDDWVYEIAAHLADNISECDGADAAQERISDWADSLVDVYNADRLKWLSSNLNTVYFVDDAVAEFGDHTDGILGAIGYGQYVAIERIAGAMLAAIEAEVDERDEAEANAQLIAAAPDLLEACQGLLAHLPDDDWSDDVKDPTCPLCGRPNPYATDDGAVEGPRAYHAECWERVTVARDAIANYIGTTKSPSEKIEINPIEDPKTKPIPTQSGLWICPVCGEAYSSPRKASTCARSHDQT